MLSNGDVYQGTHVTRHSFRSHGLTALRASIATLHASVSASFIIEQGGLPCLTQTSNGDSHHEEQWNGDSPKRRLRALQDRLLGKDTK